MNDDNVENQVFKAFMWILIVSIVGIWLALLFLPVFLPHFRRQLEKKYEKFDYRKKLIEDEMSAIKPTVWIVCITAWIITIILNLTYYP